LKDASPEAEHIQTLILTVALWRETLAQEMITSLSLLGKNAIVTGASRGIGSQVALELAARGANIAVCFVSEQSKAKADELVSRIRALGVEATSVQEDLAANGAGKRLVDKALVGLNASDIHILVNNAALDPPEPQPVHEVSPDLFDR
jgi:glucose 1-dehydrogenase